MVQGMVQKLSNTDVGGSENCGREAPSRAISWCFYTKTKLSFVGGFQISWAKSTYWQLLTGISNHSLPLVYIYIYNVYKTYFICLYDVLYTLYIQKYPSKCLYHIDIYHGNGYNTRWGWGLFGWTKLIWEIWVLFIQKSLTPTACYTRFHNKKVEKNFLMGIKIWWSWGSGNFFSKLHQVGRFLDFRAKL